MLLLTYHSTLCQTIFTYKGMISISSFICMHSPPGNNNRICNGQSRKHYCVMLSLEMFTNEIISIHQVWYLCTYVGKSIILEFEFHCWNDNIISNHLTHLLSVQFYQLWYWTQYKINPLLLSCSHLFVTVTLALDSHRRLIFSNLVHPALQAQAVTYRPLVRWV